MKGVIYFLVLLGLCMTIVLLLEPDTSGDFTNMEYEVTAPDEIWWYTYEVGDPILNLEQISAEKNYKMKLAEWDEIQQQWLSDDRGENKGIRDMTTFNHFESRNTILLSHNTR